MSSDNNDLERRKHLPPAGERSWRRPTGTAALAALLIVGAAAGAGAMRVADRFSPQSVMLLQPAAINTLRDDTAVAIKGKVANVFGNAFVVDDGTGRALVDTGPRGERRTTVAPDETVTVQGRFDRGRLQAQVLTHADGSSVGFGPPKPPPPGPRGPGDRDAGGLPPPPPGGPGAPR